MPKKLRQAFAKLGRIGGKKGGPKGGRARWENIPAEKRSEIARKAVQARWAKARTKKSSGVAKRPRT